MRNMSNDCFKPNSFLAALLLSLLTFCLPLNTLAAAAPPAPLPSPAGSNTTAAGSASSRSLNLDLSSTQASVVAGKAGTIQIGGHLSANGTVTGGTVVSVVVGGLITPAMNAALWQAIASGSQHLLLSTAGAASAGSDKINASWTGALSSLVIPFGVAVDAIGFNTAHPLNIAGSATVLGSLYALQTTAAQSALFNVGADLKVGPSGLLTSSLPANRSLPAGLVGSQSIDLKVGGDLNNSGKISTSGNLNLNVGGALNNVSVAGNPAATISAQNLNIVSGSGNIVNSGLLSAVNTVNINTTASTTNLIVNNTAGTIQATGSTDPDSGLVQNGVINLRSGGADLEAANVGVWGGVLEADGGINMFGKDMVAHVDQIIGPVNNTGSAAHISVNTGTLDIGKQTLSGDPAYYNTGGNLTIGTLQTVNGNLVLLASGDIILGNPSVIVSALTGSSIFMGAGLNFTASPDASIGSFADNAAGDNATTLGNFTAGNGNINPANAPLTFLASQNGTITVVASANGVAGKGNVNFGTGKVQAANGNVLIIGEGSVNFTGLGSGSSINTAGNVTVASSTVGGLSTLSFTGGGSTINGAPTVGTATGNLSLGPGGYCAVYAGNGLNTSAISLTANTGISTSNLTNTGTGDTTLTTNTGGISFGGISAKGNVIVQALDPVNSGTVTSTGITDTTAGLGSVVINSASGPITINNQLSNQIGVNSLGSITIGNTTGATAITIGGGINTQDSGGHGDINILSSVGPISTPVASGLSGFNITSSGNLNVIVAGGTNGINLNTSADPCYTLGASNGNINISAPGNVTVNAVTNTSGSGAVTVNSIQGVTSIGGASASNGNVTIGNAGSGTGVNLAGHFTVLGNNNLLIQCASGPIIGYPNPSTYPTMSAASGAITINPGSGAAYNIGQISSAGPVYLGTNDGVTSTASGFGFTIYGGSVDNSSGTSKIYMMTDTGTLDAMTLKSSSDITLNATTGAIKIEGGVSTPTNVSITAADVSCIRGGTTGLSNGTVQAFDVEINGVDGQDLTLLNSGTISGISSGITPGTVNIASPAGYNLNVYNDSTHYFGIMKSTGTLNLVATPSASRANKINFVTGTEMFQTDTVLQASGSQQSVLIQPNAVVEGEARMTVNTNLLVCPGSLTGNPLVFNPGGVGTIASSSGSPLNLAASFPMGLTFPGQTLTIISAGDIISSKSITINLSTLSGYGGCLTMLAGFSFNGTDSTFPLSGLYNLIQVNQSYYSPAGKINIPNVNINTSSSTGSAGNVFLAAAGSVNVGKIDASAGLKGGEVKILGNGVTAGAINSSGTTQSGPVTINAGTLQVTHAAGQSLSINQGVLYNGTISTYTPSGNISINTINAGTSGNVTLTTGSGGLLQQASGTYITCASLSAITSTGNVNLRVNAATLQLSGLGFSGGTQANNITITDNIPVTVIGVTAPSFYNAQSLTIIDPAGITLVGTASAGTLTLSSSDGPIVFSSGTTPANFTTYSATITTTGTDAQDIISIAGGSSLVASDSLTLNGTAGVQISSIGGSGAQLTAGKVNIASAKGSVTIGDHAQVKSTLAMTVAAPTGSIIVGSNTAMTAGNTPVSPSTSPLSLTTAMLTSNGSLSLTAGGPAGISAAAGSTNADFTVNGGNLTISATRGGIALGDDTDLTVNGGALTVTASGGNLQIGTASASSSLFSTITVRQLNNSNGNITMSGTNGLLLAAYTNTIAGGSLTLHGLISASSSSSFLTFADNSSTQAHGAVILDVKGSTAPLTIGNLAAVGSGVTFSGGPAGTGSMTLTSAGTASINGSLASNKAALKITSGGAFSAGAGAHIVASGNNVTINSSSSETFGVAGGGGAQVTATAQGTLYGSVTLASSNNGLVINGSSIIKADGLMALKGTGTAGSVYIDDGATVESGLTMTGNLAVSSPGTVTIGNGGAGAVIETITGTSTISLTGSGVNVHDNSQFLGAGAVTLSNTNLNNNLTFANNVTARAGVAHPASLKISSTGNKSGTCLSIGTAATLSANGGNITVSGTNASGAVFLGDSFTVAATGGTITLSSTGKIAGLPALSIGSGSGSVAGSTMQASKVGSAGGSITVSCPGNLFVGAGTLQSDTATAISSSAGSLQLSATVVTAKTTALVKAVSGVTIDRSANIASTNNLTISSTAAGSTLTINGDSGAGSGVVLSAGKLSPTAPGLGNLEMDATTKDIQAVGVLSLSAPVVAINDNGSSFTANGGNLAIIASAGTINVGSGNSFTANGGNIQLLAKSNISGATSNSFTARSQGNPSLPTSSTGGGIEVGSGLTSSGSVVTALGSKPSAFSNPASIASNTGLLTVSLTNGLIKVNKTGTGSLIDLTFNNNAAILNMPPVGVTQKGGAMVFDAQGGTTVKFQGGEFNTSGLKPIAMSTRVMYDNEAVLGGQALLMQAEPGSGDICVSVGSRAAVLESSRAGGKFALVPLPDKGLRAAGQRAGARIYASARAGFVQGENGVIDLSSGELFINAVEPVELRSGAVLVLANSGALVNLQSRSGVTQVRSCSGAGAVEVTVDGTRIRLNAGEEIIVTACRPDSGALYPADGIGRRHSRISRTGSHYVTLSDFAIITMISNSGTISGLSHANDAADRHLFARLLKSAATVDTVLKYRGAYTAAN
jgi:mucin-19